MAWEHPADQGGRMKLVPVTKLDASQWSKLTVMYVLLRSEQTMPTRDPAWTS